MHCLSKSRVESGEWLAGGRLDRLNLLLLREHTTYLGYLLVGEANKNNNNSTPRRRSEKLCAKKKTRLTTFWQDSAILEAGLILVHAVLVTLFYSSRASAQSSIPTVMVT